MATRSRTGKTGDEKPAIGKVPGKKASAGARPATEAGQPARSRKGTTVNAETAEVLRDAEAGKNLLHYPSLEAMFEDLGI